MLFEAFRLMQVAPTAALVLLLCFAAALLAAITVHEASHAFSARWQGDNTACSLGRCSLNPIRHLDPLGTVMMLMVGFGWGKPVPVNPYWLRRNGPLLGGAIVSLAGPASNLLMAAAVATPIRLGWLPWRPPERLSAQLDPAVLAAELVGFVVTYNVILGVFNLLPVAPLDGFKVVLGILPRNLAWDFAKLEQYGPGILMLLLMMGYFLPFGLRNIIGPPINFIRDLVVGRSF